MGKIELDHTGSGSGITLSSDGTDLLLDGTAIGGGGAALELYAENPVSAVTPIATGNNSISIGSNSQAASTNGNSIAIGTTARATGNSSAAFGGNYPNASAAGSLALGYTPTASGAFSAAIGYNAKAVGDSSVAFTNSYASGADSFAAAIANNTSTYGATGGNSVAIGKLAKATSTGAVGIGYETQSTGQYNSALGGYQTQATGTYHSLGLGSNARSTAFASTAINGGNTGSYATADWSVSMGGGALSNIIGKFAYSSAGAFGSGATGDAQQGTYVLRSDTTDATAEAMTTNNSTAAANNQIVLANESAYSFTGTVVCREDATDGDDYAGWEVKGVIMRQGAAADTTLGVGIVNKLYSTSGISAADVALSADTTNGGLKVEVTGVAATNIRWVATINTSEVINA